MWKCASTNGGETRPPAASMIRRASATATRETETIRPPSQAIVMPLRPSGRTALRRTKSSMRRTSSPSRADELADALRAQRHLAHAHAERRQRVVDRLGHERRHRNRTRLAHTLHAQRVERRGRLEMYDLHGRHLLRRRNVELHEGARERLARRVVRQPLVERAADALRDAAVDLSLHDHRVHDPAAVALHDVLEKAHDAGLDLDLDD